jgi:hypothetical protein
MMPVITLVQYISIVVLTFMLVVVKFHRYSWAVPSVERGGTFSSSSS